MSRQKRYIGDSVYVDFDGWSVILTTENDESGPSNIVVLEPSVWAALVEYVRGLEKERA